MQVLLHFLNNLVNTSQAACAGFAAGQEPCSRRHKSIS